MYSLVLMCNVCYIRWRASYRAPIQEEGLAALQEEWFAAIQEGGLAAIQEGGLVNSALLLLT